MSPARYFFKGSQKRCIHPRHGLWSTSHHKLVYFAYEHDVTYMPTVSVAGKLGPSLLVFKGDRQPYRVVLRSTEKNFRTRADYLPRRTMLAMRNERESVDANNFMQWATSFVQCVCDFTVADRKLLLTYDAYRFHLSAPVLQLLRVSNVIVYALPAHSSGKFQPLDATVFSAFKASSCSVVKICVTLTEVKPLYMSDFTARFFHMPLQNHSVSL